MTATDELRRLLDERGAEWIGTSFSKPAKGHPTNTSLGEEHHEATFIEYDDGNVLRLFDLTPAQAVEATLGSDLEAENVKLRELLVGAFEDMNAWQKVIAGSNEWGYGKGCLDRLCKLRDAMQELGMEVVV